MSLEPLPICLSCHTAVNAEEPAVFRNGTKIAHVRCWTPKDLAKPLRPVDEVARPNALASQADTSEPTATRPS
jgi:hypothetical protein